MQRQPYQLRYIWPPNCPYLVEPSALGTQLDELKKIDFNVNYG